MFGKSKPPKNQLTSRIRAVTTAPIPSRAPSSAGPYYPPQREQARNPREPLFRNATLLIDEKERLAVVIKNLSATGARIEYFTKLELPPVVMLVETTMKIRRRARVIWQRDGVAGLEFVR
jgi:hypothetical protein